MSLDQFKEILNATEQGICKLSTKMGGEPLVPVKRRPQLAAIFLIMTCVLVIIHEDIRIKNHRKCSLAKAMEKDRVARNMLTVSSAFVS